MLVAAEISPYGAELVGAGFGEFSGSAQIQQLQQSLTGLAGAAGWTEVNPGPITGEVNLQTMNAVVAVIGNLGGKVSSYVKGAIQFAGAMAAGNADARSTLMKLIGDNATYINGAVIALSLKYTKAPSAPPVTPSPAVSPQSVAAILPAFARTGFSVMRPPATAPLPAGSIQALTKFGTYRVAVPAAMAAALGGPPINLGEAALVEIRSRPGLTPGVQVVSEKDLEKKTGELPFWKNPTYWAIVGGTALLGGGAWWVLRR